MLDKLCTTTLYIQLAEILKGKIAQGEMVDAHGRIPSEEELGQMYDISRSTIRNCIKKLEQEGYVQRVRGKGIFVCMQRRKRRRVCIVLDSGENIATIHDPQKILSGCIIRIQRDENLAGIEICDSGRVSAVLRKIAEQADVQTGFLVMRTATDDARKMVVESGIPCILEGERHTEGCHYVDIDNRAAMRTVIDHLRQLGHANFGLVGVTKGVNLHIDERIEAAQAYLQELGFRPAPVFLAHYHTAHRTVEAEAVSFFRSAGGLPTAIVGTGDQLAAGMLRGLRAAGICVPRDVSVTGFDSRALCDFTEPPLTSVKQNYFEYGYRSADYLLRIMDDSSSGRHIHHKIKLELEVRGSTGPAPRTAIPAISDGV